VTGIVPAGGEIGRVRALVNFRNIIVDKKASTIFLKKTGMIMDVGGMKGYMATITSSVPVPASRRRASYP
jgi:thiamine biosynthesis lipoprotein ApbE